MRLRKRRRADSELREEVEDALFYDTWVDADAIKVEVKDGVFYYPSEAYPKFGIEPFTTAPQVTLPPQ